MLCSRLLSSAVRQARERNAALRAEGAGDAARPLDWNEPNQARAVYRRAAWTSRSEDGRPECHARNLRAYYSKCRHALLASLQVVAALSAAGAPDFWHFADRGAELSAIRVDAGGIQSWGWLGPGPGERACTRGLRMTRARAAWCPGRSPASAFKKLRPVRGEGTSLRRP